MKFKFFATLLLIASFAMGQAQDQPQPPGDPLGMLVFINPENGQLSAEQVYILAVTDKAVAYKYNEDDGEIERANRKEIDSIFIYTPVDYLAALDLFEGRKYAEARDAFVKIKERFKGRFPGIRNDFSTMAGYYELESLRKLGDYEGLRLALQAYDKTNLTRKVPLQQLEIYVLWDAIREKTYQEALEIAEQFKDKRLPGFQRAQVAYCKGRALEGLRKPQGEILLAYQTAITADAGASENITSDAVLRSLKILHEDEQVHLAIKTFEESDGEELIRGFTKVMEAAGLAKMYQLALGNGQPLPGNYTRYLKYTPERIHGTPEEEEEEKPKDGE